MCTNTFLGIFTLIVLFPKDHLLTLFSENHSYLWGLQVLSKTTGASESQVLFLAFSIFNAKCQSSVLFKFISSE